MTQNTDRDSSLVRDELLAERAALVARAQDLTAALDVRYSRHQEDRVRATWRRVDVIDGEIDELNRERAARAARTSSELTKSAAPEPVELADVDGQNLTIELHATAAVLAIRAALVDRVQFHEGEHASLVMGSAAERKRRAKLNEARATLAEVDSIVSEQMGGA